jgi:hypothetical protein
MTIKQQGGIFGRNPTFNDVDVEGTLTVDGNAVPDASTILVDSDIGVTVQLYDAATAKTNVSQTFTTLQNFNFAGGGNFVAIFENTSTSTPYTVNIGETSGPANGYPLFRVGQSYSPFTDYFRVDSGTSDITVGKNIRFLSSGLGIDFSATSGTGTSELFDDYEEGTWTPVVSDGTNDATMNVSTSGSYTKIGNTVFFRARARVSSLGSVSGAVRITGLPFTIANDNSNYSGGSIVGDGLNITAGQSLMYLTILGANYLSLYLTDVTTGISALDAAELSATGDLYFSGQYYV